MTEGSETWELDSKGKVVDICGTREALFFNFGHKYNKKLSTDCNMYGTEGNLFSANIPEEKNKFNSWNFREITISDEDFLSLDVKELAKERGEDGSLPEINFMKLNPAGPNYDKLKTIEEEMQHYKIFNNGTILRINNEEEEGNDKEEDTKYNDKEEDTKDNDKEEDTKNGDDGEGTKKEEDTENNKEETNSEKSSKDTQESDEETDKKITDLTENEEISSSIIKENDNNGEHKNQTSNSENYGKFYLSINKVIYVLVFLVLF